MLLDTSCCKCVWQKYINEVIFCKEIKKDRYKAVLVFIENDFISNQGFVEGLDLNLFVVEVLVIAI